VIAWLWARTVASPNPAAKGAHVPLVRSFWLSTKEGKKAWVEPVINRKSMTYQFEVRLGDPSDEVSITAGTKTTRGANFRCVLTDSPIHSTYIKSQAQAGKLGIRLLAIVAQVGSGRVYLSPLPSHELTATQAQPSWKPDGEMPENPRWFSPPEFGLSRFADIFTNRQLVLLSTFCDQIVTVRAQVKTDHLGSPSSAASDDYANGVCTYLGLGVSKVADYNSSLVLWSPTRDQAKTTFTRHALPMVWDFAEVNPFAGAAGDIRISLEGIAKTLRQLPARPKAYVCQVSATDITNAVPVVFSTDPPYYDNIGYADLSDFFYVWLRRALVTIHPDLLGTIQVPKKEELVATPYRFGGNTDAAKSFFETGLGRVFHKIYEQQSRAYPLTVYYALKQTEDDQNDAGEVDETSSRISTGWETILQSLISEGFQINGTWPIRTERGVRSVSLGTNALASSIVLVCRPRPKNANVASRRDLLTALKKELPDALRAMQKGNIAPVDLAQAAIGPGMAVFSRYAKVLEADGSPMSVRTALSLINNALDEVLAEQEGEFDADTRWAVAWFDQNGFNEGPYGVAETLSTAKNTSVSGMVEAGILTAKGGKVRLLKKEELLADWDPTTDKRLTVWEATHYLIRSLDSGEAVAASLVKKLGAMAEVARDLSYRLYTVCERRKWAQEAIGYNALVLSWPDLKRLADEQTAAGPVQRELI
jgi:putative DNA methylase